MIAAAPHIWIPRRNPLWYPGNPHVGGKQLPVSIDDIAGKPLEPSEYAALLTEIREATKIGRGVKIGRGAKLGRPSFSAFTPLDITGCVAWFDMLDAASYTQAGTVTSITNKASSVAWNTAMTAFPAYSATGFNGAPCMDLNGTNMGISSTEAAVLAAFTNTPPYTLLGAIQHDVADVNHVWFGFGNSGQPSNSSGYFGNNATGSGVWIVGLRTGGGTAINIESSGVADTNANVQEVWHTGAVVSWSVNGAAADPSAVSQDSGAVSPNRCTIGCLPRSTPLAFFDGKIGEILLYSVEHATTERAAARQYLGARWGVTVAP